MKRFFYVLTFALAALFVGCQKGSEGASTSSVSFLATIADVAEQTRLELEGSGNGWKVNFNKEQSLLVSADNSTYFTFTNTEAEPNKFSCTAAGADALLSGEVYIYNAEAATAVNSAKGLNGISLYAKASLNAPVTLAVSSAVLRFSSEYYVTLSASNGFGDGVNTLSEVTLAAGYDILVPIAAGQTTLKYTIGSNEYTALSAELQAGVIYDLGTLEPNENGGGGSVSGAQVYFVPNSDWKSADAWFAAYFWNGADSANAQLTDADADGIYECTVPAGMTDMLFCRMNPAYPEFSWNSETETDHVWNQTTDTTVGTAPYNYYYITGWDTGEWHEAGYVVPNNPASSAKFSLAGSFSGWGDVLMSEVGGVYVATNVAMEAYAEFKIKAADSWDVNFGGGLAYLNPNHCMEVFEGGSNIAITAAGTYDVYFDHANLKVYVVTAGADYSTAPLQTVDGKEPEQETPEVTLEVVYLKPNSNWKEANARFAAYFWGGATGEKWVSLTDSDSDGIYECYLPVGYSYGSNIIFCRMNPGTSANTWNNKWNQTADLVIPTDGRTLYTVTEGAWDSSDNNGWSTK